MNYFTKYINQKSMVFLVHKAPDMTYNKGIDRNIKFLPIFFPQLL